MKVRSSLVTASLILCLYLIGVAHNLADQIPNPMKFNGTRALVKPESYNNPKSRFKIDVRLVTVCASVTDEHDRCVSGLDREHFRVFEDKIEQRIEHFIEESAPVSVGLIFDRSGSMQPYFAAAKKAAQRFLENGNEPLENDNEHDELFLISFNQKVTLDADFTSRSSDIQNHVAWHTSGGRTALLDAVYMGLEKIQEARHKRKALIVISDGEDNSSRYTFQEVRELAKELDVQIYGIVQASLGGDGRYLMERLVKLTGGRCFFSYSLDSLDAFVAQIHAELRNQYVLGYYPSNPNRNGRWRKIKIKWELPKGWAKLNVRAREGYYAPQE